MSHRESEIDVIFASAHDLRETSCAAAETEMFSVSRNTCPHPERKIGRTHRAASSTLRIGDENAGFMTTWLLHGNDTTLRDYTQPLLSGKVLFCFVTNHIITDRSN